MKEHIGTPVFVYGLQRTGTNYMEDLLEKNFADIYHANDGYSRSLPTHKHFRLYDEKWIVPQMKYLNNFYYKNFSDFDHHVSEISKVNDSIMIVMVKDPYAWYQSYLLHARRNGYVCYKKFVNQHFIIDYNRYYTKWLDFRDEAPDRVMVIRYEDLIARREEILETVKQRFALKMLHDAYQNVEKVAMSRKWSAKRLDYYKNKSYVKMLNKEERHVLNHTLCPLLMKRLEYAFLDA